MLTRDETFAAAASSPLAHHLPQLVNPSQVSPPSSSPSGAPTARGRALTTSGRTVSPHSQTPVVLVGSSNNSSPDRTVERKPSVSYGHHRKASIVHGVPHSSHSRNTSFVNSPATSPLSPYSSILPTVPAGDGSLMPQDGMENISEAVTASAGDGIAHTQETVPRKPERRTSGRSSHRGHHHNRSQSRHHQHGHEIRTMGEYAMHHLFHLFNVHALQMISKCVVERGQPETRVERVCGPGVDPSFDQILSALGHVARHKPKPVIDTLMHWRKAKSDDANNERAKLAEVCRIS